MTSGKYDFISRALLKTIHFLITVLERPSSQISFLEQFLNNTSLSTTGDHFHRMAAGGSVESEEGDIEDNRVPSAESSKSNLSELSNVRVGSAANRFRGL